MHFIETCSFKINLNLRILRKRDDGFHEIHTLFWRRRSPEVLEIRTGVDRDALYVEGANIPGENLLWRACSFLRARFGADALPPIEMRLSKFLPMGSGIGAGSGNAAVLLRWFASTRAGVCIDPAAACTLGADVAFLASDSNLALADGIGEELQGLDGELNLPSVILFPSWSTGTREAYDRLDSERKCGQGSAPGRDEARAASLDILHRLRKREFVGPLPNDFIPCRIDSLPCYNEAGALFEANGALAWGLCGSGSSYFGIFASRAGITPAVLSQLEAFPWLQKILVME